MPLSLGQMAPCRTRSPSRNNDARFTKGRSRSVIGRQTGAASLSQRARVAALSLCPSSVRESSAREALRYGPGRKVSGGETANQRRLRSSVSLLRVLFLLLATNVFAHEGDHERMNFLTDAVQKAPANPLLHFELASLHARHGDVELALKDLERVDAIAPEKFLTDLSRGDAYLVSRDFNKAKEVLDRQL